MKKISIEIPYYEIGDRVCTPEGMGTIIQEQDINEKPWFQTAKVKLDEQPCSGNKIQDMYLINLILEKD